MPKINELNQRQVDFVKHYVSNGENATQAYISAGYAPTKTAPQAACRLLKRPHVVALLLHEKAKAEKKTDLSLARIEQKLSDMLEFDIADCLDEEGNMLPISLIPKKTRSMIRAIEKNSRFSKIKTESTLSLIELICKLKGYTKEDTAQTAIQVIIRNAPETTQQAVITPGNAMPQLKPEW